MTQSRPRKLLLLVSMIVLAAFLLAALLLSRASVSGPAESTAALVLGERTKTEGCLTSGPLPDRACTPGAVFSGASSAQICTPGYAKSVRDVPETIKTQVYAEYGVDSRRPRQYEVDHLVSLELGGTNDIANLWPESAEPRPGFHEKDHYEDYLHQQLCNGGMSLQEAQRRIAENWLRYWQDAGSP
jgi:hypothetical protein